MVQYRIPNLLIHLQPYIKPNNPNNNILAAEHIARIDDDCLIDGSYKKIWKHAEIPLLSSRAFPESSLNHLRICIEYLNGAFLLDQLTDVPATPAQARKWADIYKEAFRQRLEETEGPAAIINYFTDRMFNAIEDPYWTYLVKDNILLADGMAREAVDRENTETVVSLEMYIKARRDTIGARQLFDIGRWINKIDIRPDVLMHPDIVRVEEQCIDLISLANDLYSYRKEFLARDANHNYITIALEDHTTGLNKNDIQRAIDYTYNKFCQILADFEHRDLPSFGVGEDVKVAKYMGVMMEVVVGTIQWSLECGRYGHFEVSGNADALDRGDVVFDLGHISNYKNWYPSIL